MPSSDLGEFLAGFNPAFFGGLERRRRDRERQNLLRLQNELDVDRERRSLLLRDAFERNRLDQDEDLLNRIRSNRGQALRPNIATPPSTNTLGRNVPPPVQQQPVETGNPLQRIFNNTNEQLSALSAEKEALDARFSDADRELREFTSRGGSLQSPIGQALQENFNKLAKLRKEATSSIKTLSKEVRNREREVFALSQKQQDSISNRLDDLADQGVAFDESQLEGKSFNEKITILRDQKKKGRKISQATSLGIDVDGTESLEELDALLRSARKTKIIREKGQAEDTLRREFNNLSTVKNFQSIKRSFTLMNSALDAARKLPNDKSINALDSSLNVLFNKMLDPDSVVRESEFARLARGQSLLNSIGGFLERQKRGGAGITASERESLVDAAKVLFDASNELIQTKRDRFIGIAEDRGLNPGNIVDEFSSVNNLEQAATLNQGVPQATPPDQANVSVGQRLTSNGRTYQVVGFDTDGQPLVEEVN